MKCFLTILPLIVTCLGALLIAIIHVSRRQPTTDYSTQIANDDLGGAKAPQDVDEFPYGQPSPTALAIVQLIKDDWLGWEVKSLNIYHEGARVGVWLASGEHNVAWWTGNREDWRGMGFSTRADRHAVWNAAIAATKPGEVLKNIESYLSQHGTTDPTGKVPGGPHGS